MSKPKQYSVILSDEERAKLVTFTTSGVASARELRRARILLLAADEWRDADVANAVGCCAATVERVRRRCVDEGVEAALVDRTPMRWSTMHFIYWTNVSNWRAREKSCKAAWISLIEGKAFCLHLSGAKVKFKSRENGRKLATFQIQMSVHNRPVRLSPDAQHDDKDIPLYSLPDLGRITDDPISGTPESGTQRNCGLSGNWTSPARDRARLPRKTGRPPCYVLPYWRNGDRNRQNSARASGCTTSSRSVSNRFIILFDSNSKSG